MEQRNERGRLLRSTKLGNRAKATSLHLSWDEESPLSDILLEVPLRAPNLRCLGFHDGRHMMHHETSHNSDNLHDVLKQCPKLQALGWTLDFSELLFSRHTQRLMDDTVMVRLEDLILLSLAYAL
jgi:hypothetical protein